MIFKRIFHLFAFCDLLGCVFILFVLFGACRILLWKIKSLKLSWYFLVSCILFVLFVRVKSYYKKNNKKFKTVLMTSFILLLANGLKSGKVIALNRHSYRRITTQDLVLSLENYWSWHQSNYTLNVMTFLVWEISVSEIAVLKLILLTTVLEVMENC